MKNANKAFSVRSKGGKAGVHAFRANFHQIVRRVTFDGGNME